MAPLRQASPAQRRHAASARRDGALNRLSSITTAIAVATITAVGALGVYVDKALPGHHSSTSTAGSTTAPSGNSGNSGNTGSSSSLNPPSTPPQAASTPPPVTSGSS